MVAIQSFDPNLLLSFFQAQLPVASTTPGANAVTSPTGTAASNNSATSKDLPPWQAPQPSQQAEDAKVLSTTNFLNTSNVPLGATSSADAKTEQDNQKLFSLYTAVNTLSQVAVIAGRSTTPAGQLPGLNTRFQQGLQQIQSFIANTTFNNFTLQAAAQTSNVTSTAGIQFGSFTYDTKTLTGGTSVELASARRQCERQLQHRGQEGRRDDECRNRSVAGAGRTVAQQHRRLCQPAALRSRSHDAVPESSDLRVA